MPPFDKSARGSEVHTLQSVKRSLGHTFRSVEVARQTFGLPAPLASAGHAHSSQTSRHDSDQSPSTGSGCTSLPRLPPQLGQVGARRVPSGAGKKRTTQLVCRTTEDRWVGASWAVNPTG